MKISYVLTQASGVLTTLDIPYSTLGKLFKTSEIL